MSQIVRDRELKIQMQGLLEQHQRSKISGTPEHVLAKHLFACLEAYEMSQSYRDACLGKLS